MACVIYLTEPQTKIRKRTFKNDLLRRYGPSNSPWRLRRKRLQLSPKILFRNKYIGKRIDGPTRFTYGR